MGVGNLRSGSPPGIILTNVLHPADPLSENSEFDEATSKESCGLFRCRSFKVVCKEAPGMDANVLGGLLVLSIKCPETYEPQFKSRSFVVQGRTDTENYLLINYASNIKHASIRSLVAMAALFGF